MRYANLLNDFTFKYVFCEDCKEANTEFLTNRVDAAEKQIKAMILCLSSSMDKKFLVSVLNMFVHKIKKYI